MGGSKEPQKSEIFFKKRKTVRDYSCGALRGAGTVEAWFRFGRNYPLNWLGGNTGIRGLR
jgi:hypothetical protein